MHVLKEIKIGRLVLAVLTTLLIADTIPHPNLSAGVVESSLSRVRSVLAETREAKTALAESPRQ